MPASTSKHRFYAPPDHFGDGIVRLPEDEARHALKVLRLGKGDDLTVVDGIGGTWDVQILETGRNDVVGEIRGHRMDEGEPRFHLTVGLALIKQAARFETFLEKAVELGVSAIWPLESRRSERSSFKERRADMILKSALKQSGRSRLPLLHPVSDLEDVIAGAGPADGPERNAGGPERNAGGPEQNAGDPERNAGGPTPIRLIAHESVGEEDGIRRVLESLRLEPAGSGAVIPEIQVLVGPEAGFAEDEIEGARKEGWRTVSLGPRRLRAETAAIAISAFIVLHLEG